MQKRAASRPAEYIDRSPKGFSLRNGCSVSTTYSEMRSGRLKARKVGNSTYISEDAEQAWIDSLPAWIPESERAEA